MKLVCINKIGVSVTSDYCVHSSLVQEHCTCLDMCKCTKDTDMDSLYLRLFMTVHGCWKSMLWYDICPVIGISLSQLLELVSRISYQDVLGTY